MEHRVLELKRNIIVEKRKMNQTLKELINTDPSLLDELELHYERLARAVRACERYNIYNRNCPRFSGIDWTFMTNINFSTI